MTHPDEVFGLRHQVAAAANRAITRLNKHWEEVGVNAYALPILPMQIRVEEITYVGPIDTISETAETSAQPKTETE